MEFQPVKSVVKAFAILELLTSQTLENKTLTLSEISKATGILPVTARNLLRTLESCGYASRVSHGHYREGDRCTRLFRSEGVLRKLREVSEPLIRQTVWDLGESLLLVTMIRNRRVELLRCQADKDDLVDPKWAANEKAYQMRTTRAILAWFTDKQLDAYIQTNGLPSPEDWPECEASRSKLATELKKIRLHGGCCDVHGGYMALAVPIMTTGNEAVASLGCYVPHARTDKPRTAGIFKMLHDCATLIEQRM
ncbi:MAG: IclR family transcriptional regulator [Phycisphaeraceae bacterium JB051]